MGANSVPPASRRSSCKSRNDTHQCRNRGGSGSSEAPPWPEQRDFHLSKHNRVAAALKDRLPPPIHHHHHQQQQQQQLSQDMALLHLAAARAGGGLQEAEAAWSTLAHQLPLLAAPRQRVALLARYLSSLSALASRAALPPAPTPAGTTPHAGPQSSSSSSSSSSNNGISSSGSGSGGGAAAQGCGEGRERPHWAGPLLPAHLAAVRALVGAAVSQLQAEAHQLAPWAAADVLLALGRLQAAGLVRLLPTPPPCPAAHMHLHTSCADPDMHEAAAPLTSCPQQQCPVDVGAAKRATVCTPAHNRAIPGLATHDHTIPSLAWPTPANNHPMPSLAAPASAPRERASLSLVLAQRCTRAAPSASVRDLAQVRGARPACAWRWRTPT